MNRFNFNNNGRCGNDGYGRECNQNNSHCNDKMDCSCDNNCEPCPPGVPGSEGAGVHKCRWRVFAFG